MGIIEKNFKEKLIRKLSNNSALFDALGKMDESVEKLKNSIDSAEENGVIIPDELKHYLGLKDNLEKGKPRDDYDFYDY